MAPEILATGYTTKQSDIYQLGLLMFQMHTGRPAIDVDRTQYGETTRMIAEGTPLALAERALAMLAAFLLVAALPVTDEAGFVLSAVFLLWHWRQTRHPQKLPR